MRNCFISIVIPVYNVEKYLRECLDSIINQTYEYFEAILVNDGSTDSSMSICSEYSSKDSRFKVISKQNGGASSARNVGIDNAEGEYILFVDSDDLIEKDALSKMVDYARKDDVDFVFYEAEAFDDTTGKTEKNKYSYHRKYETVAAYLLMRQMIKHNEFHVVPWAMLIKKEFLDKHKIRFYEGIVYEDLIFSYKVYSLADRAAHIHECLYKRRYRDGSVMQSEKIRKNFESAYTVYKEVIKFSETLDNNKINFNHIIRCAYNALNVYKALSGIDKAILKPEYNELKKSILNRNSFGDKALQYRCYGYRPWIAYKAMQKLFIGAPYQFAPVTDDKNKVMMLIPHMVGGGAERVAAQIINKMNEDGYSTRFMLSADRAEDVVRSDLNEKTLLLLLGDEMPKQSVVGKLFGRFKIVLSSLLCKPFEAFKKPVPAVLAEFSVASQYSREIKYLRKMLEREPDLKVITFLQPTIPIILLAARGLNNKIIISERADPNRLMKKRYGYKFIKKYYERADKVVFQTIYAKDVYPKNISDKGSVIPNPLKEGLPEPYFGERNKFITTFCRISNQKNLPLLIDAFRLLHKDYPEYTLRIIGDAPNAEGEEVVARVKQMIESYGLQSVVRLEPHQPEVHRSIIKDAMYVSSSDYEGISNSMLESLAIGMPSVCTDCPVGGARTTITDGENGLLVPINDAEALYKGMKRLIEDKALSEKLSKNAASLRSELTLDKITGQWENLL